MNIVTRRVLSQLSKCINPNQKSSPIYLSAASIQNKLNYVCRSTLQKSLFHFSQSTQSIFQQAPASGQSNIHKYLKNPNTIALLQKKGVKTLFPIQTQTYQAVYNGRDILASDRTGSGKTIAYSLPIIQKMRDTNQFGTQKQQVKFLILCPTRELSLQVFKQINSLKLKRDDFNVVAVYGGAGIDQQIRDINNGVDIIVATPGRLMDLLERKIINFTELQATCIDQADQMLEKGFKLDIQQIFGIITKQRKEKTQNLMFSATIPDWVDKISREYLASDKKRVNLINRSQNKTSKTVQHLAIQVRYHQRIQTITNLMKLHCSQQMGTIIFSERKIQVTQIASEFGKKASFLQGDLSQKEREYHLNNFRSGKTKILIATDVASRGLDIDNVGLVIQLEPPRNTQPFIHRSGRTGRAGRKGVSVMFFEKKNLNDLIRIQDQANITFTHTPKPLFQQSGQVWQRKLTKMPNQLKRINKQSLKNQKINLLAQTLLASNEDTKQILKRCLLLCSGQPPRSISITTQQVGMKTFAIQQKDPSSSLSSLSALSFLKQNLSVYNPSHVHAQSKTILFDIDQSKCEQFLKKCQQLLGDPQQHYNVRSAVMIDREMPSLKELSKFSGRSMGRQTGRQTHRQTHRQSRQRGLSSANDFKVFIPSLPLDVEKQDLIQILQAKNIQFTNINLVKRQDKAFAFVQLMDAQSLQFIIQSGILIDNQKVKVLKSKEKQQRSGNFENRSNYGNDSRGGYGNESRASYGNDNRGQRSDRGGFRNDRGGNQRGNREHKSKYQDHYEIDY